MPPGHPDSFCAGTFRVVGLTVVVGVAAAILMVFMRFHGLQPMRLNENHEDRMESVLGSRADYLATHEFQVENLPAFGPPATFEFGERPETRSRCPAGVRIP